MYANVDTLFGQLKIKSLVLSQYHHVYVPIALKFRSMQFPLHSGGWPSFRLCGKTDTTVLKAATVGGRQTLTGFAGQTLARGTLSPCESLVREAKL